MINSRENEVINLLKNKEIFSSKEIFDQIHSDISYATLKRILAKLVSNKYIESSGQGKGTKYSISAIYDVIRPIDTEQYYQKEIDEREIKEQFNFEIITEVLSKNNIFSSEELENLELIHKKYLRNISQLSEAEYAKELDRLAIDLSWKSSQIEGNTYSLLETERLLREKETASGKTKEEAVMLLNHKDAIDFLIENKDYLSPISVAKIEDIHSILVKELDIDRNLRKRRVGISGTNYRPLDNEFQIKEALKLSCDVINKKENVFEKALLTIVTQ